MATPTLRYIFDTSYEILCQVYGPKARATPRDTKTQQFFSRATRGACIAGKRVDYCVFLESSVSDRIQLTEDVGVPPNKQSTVAVFHLMKQLGHEDDDVVSDVVFFGLYKIEGHDILQRENVYNEVWVDPTTHRPYQVLHGEPVLRFAARHFDMHVGQTRETSVCPHIVRHGLQTHHSCATSCLIEWLTRCAAAAPERLRRDLLDAGSKSTAALIEWLYANDGGGLIPDQSVASTLDRLMQDSKNSKEPLSADLPLPADLPVDQNKPPPKELLKKPKGPKGRSRRVGFNNIVYASVLEARWAFLFTNLGINFSYESLCVNSMEIEALQGRSYKPDFYLRDQGLAIEVKPTPPTRHERLLAAAFVRAHGPLVLLWGGSGHGGGHLFTYPTDDERGTSAAGCVPHALLFDTAATSASGVDARAVYLGRCAQGWGFVPICDIDASLTAEHRASLRELHEFAAQQFR